MSVLNNSNAIESGGYNIDRSLRFRSSASAYLNRTPASNGSRMTWTWSGWVKRGTLGSVSDIFTSGQVDPTYTYMRFGFTSDNCFECIGYDGGGVGLQFYFKTSQVFRDPSAWYHIAVALDTTNATSTNRTKIYVNGSQVTSFQTGTFSTTYPALNDASWVNTTTYPANISRFVNASNYFDGYLAEVNFIDGQALTPSSFGETSTETGVWVPKKYTGTYGTNGFYLNFSDNTSATTLAYDKSGNGNNWTANNISTTAGATYDSMTDVPTLTSATAANFCTWNPINKHSSVVIQDANLAINTGTTGEGTLGTIGVSSGKWYFEFVANSVTGGWPKIGIAPVTADAIVANGIFNTGYAYAPNATKRSPGSDVSYGASWTSGDVIGVALDMDAGTLTFYKNNTSQGTAFTGLSGTFAPAVMVYGGSSINFGQRPFSYTPPTGFKALNTFNLPDPTIKKPNQYMDATLYTGTGSTLAVTNAAGFQPDFVWVKGRSGATDHALYDAVRGTTKQLESNTTTAETTEATGLTAFNSNGFSVGALAQMNTNTATYVGWQWKESATAGFDIVTYTGDGTNGRAIAHSLGVAPKMVIVKIRNAGYRWMVYFQGSTSNSQALHLNEASAISSLGVPAWSTTNMTSSTFGLGNNEDVNQNGSTYVAYLFSEIPGFSKFGVYTGNGSSDGPFVYCGFRPKYVMLKDSNSGVSNWWIMDTSRNTYNLAINELRADLSNAELTTAYSHMDIVSNGFKLRTSSSESNTSGNTIIYAAFAENPMKYSLAR